MLSKTLDRDENAPREPARSCQLILLYIFANFRQVGDSRFGPDYSHDGAGSSRFLPHERSQRAAFS